MRMPSPAPTTTDPALRDIRNEMTTLVGAADIGVIDEVRCSGHIIDEARYFWPGDGVEPSEPLPHAPPLPLTAAPRLAHRAHPRA